MAPDTLLQRAVRANAARRFRRAVQLCDVALNSRPPPELDAALRVERASACVETGEWARAERDCRRALDHAPNARAFALLARCHLEKDEGLEAVAQIEQALALDPPTVRQSLLYARSLSAAGQHDAAIRAAAQARQQSSDSDARSVQLRILAAAGRHEELVAVATQDLVEAPQDADTWTQLGLSLTALGRSEAAVSALREALALEPERVDANCGLGMALLRLGHLAEGLRFSEHRQKNAGEIPRFGVKPWRGEPLDKAHLMVFPEQGLGDTIQFARFVPALRRRAARVTFLVPRPLVRLLNNGTELAAQPTTHPGFGGCDYQTLVMSLPHLLGTGTDAGVGALPLLFPEPDRVRRWAARLPTGRKVGLAWQGNPRYAGEPWRSMPFLHFEPLISELGPDITWISLQKYVGREQLLDASLGARVRVLDLADEIDDQGHAFVDSLAILSLLDAFVTTDTALAHVAGSAGIRSWLLLSHVADWRWGVERECSPWYPSVKLIRQASWGDWAGVIERLRARMTVRLSA
jgi:tetratricopeptide (TPR) repeat protein